MLAATDAKGDNPVQGADTRRVGGLGLVVLALIAAVAISATRSTVAGRATAPPVPPAPAVGDCVLTAPTGIGWDDRNFGSSMTGEPPATARTGPCTGTRFGEIVAVGTADRAVDGQLRRWTQCDEAAVDYLGLPVAADRVERLWQPTYFPMTGFLWPSRRQAATGQRWAACVVALPADDGSTGPTDPVDFSLHGGWPRPQVRDRMSTCVDDAAATAPCGAPHRGEILAFADVISPALTQEQLDRGCRDTAAEQLGRADVTAGGSLTVEVVIGVQRGSTELDQDLPAPADLESVRNLDPPAIYVYAQCMVRPTAADTRLVGSLRDLGDAPVPFTR